VSDRVDLERRYRRWLACYPRDFRQEHGREILDVLMACAPADRRRPGPAAAADLVRSGLALRLHPRVPGSPPTVRAAVRLMEAGAAASALGLIVAVVALAAGAGRGAVLRLAGQHQPSWVAVTVGIAGGLAVTTLWLTMARAVGRGRHWARPLSTALSLVATLEMVDAGRGVGPSEGALFWVPTALVGLAAVVLLWHPASRASGALPVVTPPGQAAGPSPGAR
jgi:hypothetical protein